MCTTKKDNNKKSNEIMQKKKKRNKLHIIFHYIYQLTILYRRVFGTKQYCNDNNYQLPINRKNRHRRRLVVYFREVFIFHTIDSIMIFLFILRT